MGGEVYHNLKSLIKEKYGKQAAAPPDGNTATQANRPRQGPSVLSKASGLELRKRQYKACISHVHGSFARLLPSHCLDQGTVILAVAALSHSVPCITVALAALES
jgi:hypothetical protein